MDTTSGKKLSQVGILRRQAMKMLFFRLTGSVMWKIWGLVVFNGIYTTAIVCIHNYLHGMEINFPHTLIAVLGPVTGLLLVFRTNTAYDRYWQGRKIWSQMETTIRTLTRYVWILVEDQTAEDIVEKVTVLNLLVAFPFAVKNYLRAEYSYEKDNIKDLISHLPRFSCSPIQDQLKAQSEASIAASNVEIWLKIPSEGQRRLSSRRSIWKIDQGDDKDLVTNIPMEITYYFTAYLNKLAKNPNPIPATFMNTMNVNLTNLTDSLSGLERILNTPIPIAYAVHLEHSVWIYLLALPYQLVGQLNWWTIPAVTLASFALLGILGIGDEIENPFGYDYNDLPLGKYCDKIQREVYVMSGRLLGDTDAWIKSTENHPLSPTTFMSAHELCKAPMADVEKLLAQRAEHFKLE